MSAPHMHTSLARETAGLIWRHHRTLFAVTALNVVLSLTCNAVMSRIKDLLPWWLVLKLVVLPATDTFWAKFVSQTAVTRVRRYIEREWSFPLFARATDARRNECGVIRFNKLKTDAAEAVDQAISLFTWQGSNVICDASSALLLLWENPVWMSIGIAYCISIWFILRSWHGRLVKQNGDANKIYQAGTVDTNRLSGLFQNNPVKYIAEIAGIEQRSIDIDYALGVAWLRFGWVKFTLLGLPLILVCTFPKDQYLFAVMMFGGVLRAMSGSMALNTQLLRHQNNYTTFRNLVQEELGEYEDPPEQMPLPAVITITDIDIRPPTPADVAIEVDENSESTGLLEDFDPEPDTQVEILVKHTAPISIHSGEMILLQGASGSGKTSFLSGLTGKLPGVQLEGNAQPGNIKHHNSEFYQSINEDLEVRNTTISRLFRGAKRSVIEDAARICGCLTLVRKLRMHRKITRKLSGGEKSRLTLSTILVDCIENMRPVFIADEPDRGVDPELAYEIIRRVRERLVINPKEGEPHRIMFLATHLERVEEEFTWSKIMRFQNGRIKVE
jgi:ABC-type ATPase involved in cell division